MSDSRMRCSECKSFRMCIFNPDAKDGESETFGCFNFHAIGEIQAGAAKPTKSRVKIAGIYFWVIGFIVLAAGIFFIIGASLIDEPSGPGYYLAGAFGILGFIGIVVGGLCALFGIFLYISGKSQEQQKDINAPEDVQKDFRDSEDAQSTGL